MSLSNYQEGDDILMDAIYNKTPSMRLDEEMDYVIELKKGINAYHESEYYAMQLAKRNKIASGVILFFIAFIFIASSNKSLTLFGIFCNSALVVLCFYVLAFLFIRPVLMSYHKIETIAISRQLTEDHIKEVERYINELKLLNIENHKLIDTISYLTEYAHFLGHTPEKHKEFFDSNGDNK